MVDYLPNCSKKPNFDGIWGYWTGVNWICVNIIYDLNGQAKPNRAGKDIGFISAIYPDDEMVIVGPKAYPKLSETYDYYHADAACKEIDKDLVVPNIEEVMSVARNWYALVDRRNGGNLITSVKGIGYTLYRDYVFNFTIGNMTLYRNPATNKRGVVCIKR